MGALLAREDGAGGQHVSISIQECLAAILELTFEYWPYMGLVASRLGQKPIQPLDFLECKDGWIFLCCVEEHQWRTWVAEVMKNPEWASLEIFENRLARAANWDALKVFLQEWVADHTVDELYHAGQAHRVPIAPVSTMADLLASDHLKSRGFFAMIEHPEAGAVRYPGAPYHFGCTPWTIRRPAPLLGEHTRAVLRDELQLPADAIAGLQRQGII